MRRRRIKNRGNRRRRVKRKGKKKRREKRRGKKRRRVKKNCEIEKLDINVPQLFNQKSIKNIYLISIFYLFIYLFLGNLIKKFVSENFYLISAVYKHLYLYFFLK